MTEARRWPLILAWLAALLAAAVFLGHGLPVRGDLSAFLPDTTDTHEQLLREQLQAGGGSGLMLAAISEGSTGELAAASKQLTASLRQDSQFLRVENGDRKSRDAVREWVLANRYLLSPEIRAEKFTRPGLKAALNERLIELASPADVVIKDLLPRDPTGETLAILDNWSGSKPPRRKQGVWFDRNSEQALLLIETVAPGFDLDAQERGQRRITDALAAFNQREGLKLQIALTGPGPFGVTIRDRTRSQAIRFSAIASICLAAMLIWAFGRMAPVLICGLPLATGALCGACAVWLTQGSLHGITLAFGVTVLGVAIDYPIHFYGHCDARTSPRKTVRSIWDTMLLGAVSTCMAYAAMLFSGVTGLVELAVFTITGLLAALLSVRFLLPWLLTADAGPRRRPGRIVQRLSRIPAGPELVLLVLVAAIAGHVGMKASPWENDLAALSPVPDDLLEKDGRLREAIGAPEPRYQIAVTGPDVEGVLLETEQLVALLDDLVSSGRLGGHETITRFLPTAATQRRRLAAIPDNQVLLSRLQGASEDLPFREGYFAPFLEDASKVRNADLLTVDALQDSPFAARAGALLRQREDGSWVALLPLRGVADPAGIAARTDAANLHFIDLKGASESMVAHYRGSMLKMIGWSALAILLLAWLGLRSLPVLLRVMLPVAAAVLTTALIMRVLQGPLNLFNLVSLLLVGGLVLDYALFLNRREPVEERARSRDAVLLCALSTLTVFGILAYSDIPVLFAIGATVAVGVIAGLLLASLQAPSEINGSVQTET